MSLSAIFEAFSYIVLYQAKIVTHSSTYQCHVSIVINVWAACGLVFLAAVFILVTRLKTAAREKTCGSNDLRF